MKEVYYMGSPDRSSEVTESKEEETANEQK